ncbi:hypothetical protein [Streptomyces sp. NPDC058625]|uniref:hypothetical protein n=1 Tax=Streptomyces sp. NPDC058625 TaxID=3346564 RepID=UPI00365EB122
MALLLLAVLCVQGCSVEPSKEKPDTATSVPPAPYHGNREYVLPDSPFTREDTVITATCGSASGGVGVLVQAWDPERWEPRGERYFRIPDDAALGNFSDFKVVNSPLVDLCGMIPANPSPYGVDDLEYMSPRVRALFDLAFTRMAVVFRNPDDRSTHAGFVESGTRFDTFVRLSGATGDDEQNAVMSPDGSGVWFTYTDSVGEHRIGSRPVEGDHGLSDEGPATGHDLPLVVSGKPPLAVQANMVRLAPDGRHRTATAPKVFGHVFDTRDSSGPLTQTKARSVTLLRGCVGIVGWIRDDSVLCRNRSGFFRAMDARSGRATGAEIAAVHSNEGSFNAMIAEGMLVSADGKWFIVAVHEPNDRYGYRSDGTDFRVVSTSGEGEATRIVHESLTNGTVFLEWR